jgi:hypothetical protein
MASPLRRTAGCAAAALILSTPLAAAHADDIYNDLDTTIDATAESMSLAVDGPHGTTNLRVQPRNGDGKNGCNIQGGEVATFAVTSSDPAVATVSPGTVTFDSCGAAPQLTVAGRSAGTATVTLSELTNTTGGSFDVAPATFTVSVTGAPANTAPTVDVTGVSDGQLVELGIDAAPVPGCAADDAEDGPSAPAPVVDDSGLDGLGLGDVTVTCSVTDAGGLTATDVATYTVVDTTPPVITRTGITGSEGWNGEPVTATWSCADAGVGVVSDTVSATTVGEGSSLGVTGTCEDRLGLTSSDTRDGIRVDLTAPTVAWSHPIADGSSHYFGQVPGAPGCDASDALSGLAEPCTVSGHGTTVGDHTVTAAATDNAGHTTTLTSSYRVLAWSLSGYHRPVDMGVWNTVKGGSTVPLKFEVFAGQTELTSLDAIGASFAVTGVAGPGSGAAADPIELTTTGGTSLRYDDSAGQFVQNWQTPRRAGACYRVTTTTADGTSVGANFILR